MKIIKIVASLSYNPPPLINFSLFVEANEVLNKDLGDSEDED